MSEIRDQAELQRMFEETKKFVAEAHKLEAEQRKLQAERDLQTAATIKSYAETAKINRDRWLAPVIATGAAVGSIIGAASAVYRLIIG
jgi:hypothetical protein